MKKKTILLIVLISLAVFIVFGVVSGILFGTYIAKHDGFFYEYSTDDAQDIQKMDVSLDGVNTIEISGVSDDVQLIESGGLLTSELVTTQYLKTAQLELSTYVLDDTAYVKVIYPETNIHINASHLSVGIPADFTGKVSVENVSGNVYGDIKNNLSAVSVVTTSGSLRLSLTSLKDINVKSLSGNVDLDADITGAVKVNSTSGVITIDNMNSKDANVDIETVSGNVDIRYIQACPTVVNTTSGITRIVLEDDAAIALDYSSTSGSLTEPVRTDPNGITFDVTSISGDLSFE